MPTDSWQCWANILIGAVSFSHHHNSTQRKQPAPNLTAGGIACHLVVPADTTEPRVKGKLQKGPRGL